MRTLTLVLLTTLLFGCANRDHIVTMTNDHYPAKNPQRIALFSNGQTPLAAYRVIGHATVSRYNLLGDERLNSDLHVKMKELAAGIGGDGLINVKGNEQAIEGNVIAYQKILI